LIVYSDLLLVSKSEGIVAGASHQQLIVLLK